jgi:alkaline phosphatase
LRAHIASSNAATEGDAAYRRFVKKELVEEGLGVMDASDEEIDLIISNPALSAYAFADIISRRAQIGWSTHGHSAVDVNIYGHGAEVLRGNHENIEVGGFLRNYLNVDVDAVTAELNSNKASGQTLSLASEFDVPEFGHYEERLKKNLPQ